HEILDVYPTLIRLPHAVFGVAQPGFGESQQERGERALTHPRSIARSHQGELHVFWLASDAEHERDLRHVETYRCRLPDPVFQRWSLIAQLPGLLTAAKHDAVPLEEDMTLARVE